MFAVLLVLTSWLLPKGWQASVATVAVAAVAAGFTVRLSPVLLQMWRSAWGKAAFALANVAFVLIAQILAQQVVAKAFGYPPEDFEQTINVMTMLLVVPVASVLVCASLSALTMVLFVSGVVAQFARKQPEAGLVVMGHGMGALALVGFITTYITFPLGWIKQPPAWVGNIAYEADFHELRNQPGAPEGQRVHLLKDGRLAVATANNGDISITDVSATAVPEQLAGSSPSRRAHPKQQRTYVNPWGLPFGRASPEWKASHNGNARIGNAGFCPTLHDSEVATMHEIHDELYENGNPSAYRFCCPIVIGNFSVGVFLEPSERILVQPGEDLPRLRSGTLTFVRHDDEIYGLTCAHVVQALDVAVEARIKEHQALCGVDAPFPPEVWPRFFFPRGNTHFDINVQFERVADTQVDVAAGWIPPDIFAATGREAIDIGPWKELPDAWPEEAGALATGYPEANRRIYQRATPDDTVAWANVTLHGRVTKSWGGKIRLTGELSGEEPLDADVLSGMSGGPILVTCGNQWGLAGIVSGGSDLKAYAKANQAGFFVGPAMNVEGEGLHLPNLRTWLDTLKGRTTGRANGHVVVQRVGNMTVMT